MSKIENERLSNMEPVLAFGFCRCRLLSSLAITVILSGRVVTFFTGWLTLLHYSLIRQSDTQRDPFKVPLSGVPGV